MSRCLRCGNEPTVRAHIFPKSAIRAIRFRGPDTKTMAIFDDRAIPANNPNGVFDDDILCARCDSRIGVVDKWFVESLDALHADVVDRPSYTPSVLEIDADAALRFAVSVIYRAALSRLDHFAQILLGPYTNLAGNVAVGSGDADLEAPLVLINVLTSDELDMRQWAFYPVRCATDNGSYFVFALSGVQFLVKFGGRHPGVSSNDRYSSQLRIKPGNNVAICPYLFVDSAEFDFMRQIKRSSEARRR